MYITLNRWVQPMKLYPASYNPQNTILDERLEYLGGRIDLPRPVTWHDKTYSYLLIPPEKKLIQGDTQIISSLYFAANKVIQLIYTARTEQGLNVAVSRFLDEVDALLSGKNGLINRQVLAARIPEVVWGVLLYDPYLAPSEIKLNARQAKKAGIKEGEVIFVKREPTLHIHSIIPRKVVFGAENNVIYLPKEVFQGLAADCDGDIVVAIKITDDNLRAQAERRLVEAEWLETDYYKTTGRFGLTTSVQQMISDDHDPELKMLCKHTDDMDKFVRGLSDGEMAEVHGDIVKKNVFMKLRLGFAGRVAQLLRLIAETPQEIASANYLADYVTQNLLDSKHGGTPLVESFTNVLENFPNYDTEQIVQALAQRGLDPVKVRPILRRLDWYGTGITRAAYTASPLFAVTQRRLFSSYDPSAERRNLTRLLFETRAGFEVSDIVREVSSAQ